jgi:hypothetical protein
MLSSELCAAIPRLLPSVHDEPPEEVRRVRLYVLDCHEWIASMLDVCLTDLILAFYPIRRRRDVPALAGQLALQVERLSFHTKLSMLKPSMQDCCEIDFQALDGLTKLRNAFAHRSIGWKEITYRGRSLWSERPLEQLKKDLDGLVMEIDHFRGGIDEAKRKAEKRARGLYFRRFLPH